MTDITIETERIVHIYRRCRAEQVWCDACGDVVMMIAASAAAQVLACGERELPGCIDGLHYANRGEGILVCVKSLLENR